MSPRITTCGPSGRPEVALDMVSPEFSAEIYQVYDDIRSQCPVIWSRENGGFWFLSGYAQVAEAAGDHDSFVSSQGVSLRRDHGPATFQPPITTDPPDTQEYRRLTLGALSPGATARLHPLIQVRTDELIDNFIEAGRADLVNDLLTPLPARMILHLLGLDESGWPMWVKLVHTFVQGVSLDAMVEASTEMVRLIEQVLDSRAQSAEPRGEDLCTLIMNGSVHGRPLTRSEQVRYMFLMLAGGMDTTSGFCANTVIALAGDHDLRSTLVERRDLRPQALEEFLRLFTPTQGLARTASKDLDFHGQQIRAGETVMLMYAAANRDPGVFANADRVDITRSSNRHLAFGLGVHRCLGSNLARAMATAMLNGIFDRLPDFDLIDPVVDRYENASIVYAPRSLPVRFTPGPRRRAQRSHAASPGVTGG